MANGGCYTDVLNGLPCGAAGYSTSPDPPSRRTKTNNPYMPPNGFCASAHTEVAHRADDITPQALHESMPASTLVVGVASLLALRDQHAQASVRPLSDKQAERDHFESEWMCRRSAFKRASSNGLSASELYASSDEQPDEEGDADFDLLSLLCPASEPIVPDSVTLPTHVSGDDTAKSQNMSQQRQSRVSQLLTHSEVVPPCSAKTQILAAPKFELYTSFDEQLDEEEDADLDLLSLLCSASEPIVPDSVTLLTHVSGDDTAKPHKMSQQRQSRFSQLLTHSVVVPPCSAQMPQTPAAPKLGRPIRNRRPLAD